MFSVIFEMRVTPGMEGAYASLRDELDGRMREVHGFVDNHDHRSLTRDDVRLSLSTWVDEKALVRWRTDPLHHDAQGKSRNTVFDEYRFRVGENAVDSAYGTGQAPNQQRFDETQAGDAPSVTLIATMRPPTWRGTSNAADCAEFLGLNPYAPGMVSWDLFEDLAVPDSLLLLVAWKAEQAAQAFEDLLTVPEDGRLRRVRVVRDYGRFDRREAPQYFPERTD